MAMTADTRVSHWAGYVFAQTSVVGIAVALGLAFYDRFQLLSPEVARQIYGIPVPSGFGTLFALFTGIALIVFTASTAILRTRVLSDRRRGTVSFYALLASLGITAWIIILSPDIRIGPQPFVGIALPAMCLFVAVLLLAQFIEHGPEGYGGRARRLILSILSGPVRRVHLLILAVVALSPLLAAKVYLLGVLFGSA